LTRRKTAKKASTLAIDVGRIERHIKPLRVRLLGAIFTYAVRCRMRPDNPVHGVVLFADGKRERRLSDDEYKALGKALREAETANVWPAAIAATRFLALTGWRSGEALTLRWDEIDLGRRTAMLGDTKIGASMRPLSHAACDVLRSLTRSGELVFPATRQAKRDEKRAAHRIVVMSGFKKFFKKIAALGKPPGDVTPHTMRHSFTSLAADLGYSEPVIAAMVGHKGRTMTTRYVHSADAVLLAAADAVADRAAVLMTGKLIQMRRTAEAVA
jgi:integrase